MSMIGWLAHLIGLRKHILGGFCRGILKKLVILNLSGLLIRYRRLFMTYFFIFMWNYVIFDHFTKATAENRSRLKRQVHFLVFVSLRKRN